MCGSASADPARPLAGSACKRWLRTSPPRGECVVVVNGVPRVGPAAALPAVLQLPGPANPSFFPLVAVPGLGLSVQVPAHTLRLLQAVIGSTVIALPGYGLPSAA